jgi:predicted component of type VI protein secretion system
MERGPEPGVVYALQTAIINLGRSPANEIPVNDAEVSRHHSQLVLEENGYAVRDMGSTNGTFVNGQRCTGLTRLVSGDIVEMGDTIRFRYEVIATPPDSALSEDEMPTGPVSVTLPQPPMQPRPTAVPSYQDLPAQEPAPTSSSRRIWLGCGCGFLLLLFLCGVLMIALDAYAQGRLLYCGGLRPFWEIVLGPFGFNPLCP